MSRPPQNDVGLERYKNNDTHLVPATKEKTRKLYLEIYHTYVLGHMTLQQVADVYKKNVAWISKIVKWACHQLDKGDKRIYKQVMEDSLCYQLQSLEETLQRAKKNNRVRDELAVMSEIRRTMRLLGQVRSIINDVPVEAKTPININIPQLNRGEGTSSVREVKVDGGV